MVKFRKQNPSDALTVLIPKDYAKGTYVQKYIDEYDVKSVLDEFSENPLGNQKWFPLISNEMYDKAITEFVKYGTFPYFPHKHIFQWVGIIMRNVAKLFSDTALHSRASWLPIEECERWLVERHKDYVKDGKWETCRKALKDEGLYNWMIIPDGTMGMSDYGIKPLLDILSAYTPQTSVEECFIIINRCLNVIHYRGDLSSIFIDGGKKSLDKWK